MHIDCMYVCFKNLPHKHASVPRLLTHSPTHSRPIVR